MLYQKAVADYLDYLEIEKNRSLSTIINYDHYLKRLTDFAGPKLEVEAIDLELISKFRRWLNRLENQNQPRLAVATRNYHLIALRNLLKYLAKKGVVSLNPAQIELANFNRRLVTFLTLEEVERLLAVFNQSDLISLRNRSLLELLFSSGCRVSELVSLNQQQLDFKNREFSLRGKGGKDRVVFLTQAAVFYLKKYLAKRADQLPALFISRQKPNRGLTDGNYRRLTARSVQRIVKAAGLKSGLSKSITPHTLRHSFATNLLQNGADLRSIQDMLGHAHLATTQIYTHTSNPQLKSVHQRYHSRNQKKIVS